MKRYPSRVAFILLFALTNLQCNQSHYRTLSSSFWLYSDNDISYEILFKPEGHVYSYHPNDATPENDFWKQKGNKVIISMNDNYARYKGKLINDSTIVGKGRSKGFEWSWTAKFIANH